jgi:DNA-binding MarR family transcriptional regulator
MFEDLEDVGFRLNIAARALRKELNTSIRQQGLDDMMYIILRALDGAAQEGRPAITVADVATELNLQPDAVSQAADRLIRDGWITQLDSSSRLIALSGKARSAIPALVDTAAWTTQRALNGFTDDEAKTFLEFLRRVYNNLR